MHTRLPLFALFFTTLLLAGCVSPIYTSLDEGAEEVVLTNDILVVEKAERIASIVYPGPAFKPWMEAYARNVAIREGGNLVLIDLDYSTSGEYGDMRSVLIDVYRR